MNEGTRVRRRISGRKIVLFLGITLTTGAALELFSVATAGLYGAVLRSNVLPARVALTREKQELSSSACSQAELPGPAGPLTSDERRTVRVVIWNLGTSYGQRSAARDYRLLPEHDIAAGPASWARLAQPLGIPTPSYAPPASRNVLAAFYADLRGGRDCLAARLARLYSEREARLFQFAALTGYSCMIRVVMRDAPEPYPAELMLSGELAGIPPHLLAGVRTNVKGKSKDEAIELLLGAQSAVEAFLASEPPTPR